MRLLENKKSSTETECDGDTRSRERERDSMKDMEPLNMPDEEKISETPRRSRPSRIPLHTAAHKGLAPKPPAGAAKGNASRDSVPYRSRNGESPARPPSSHSCRSAASIKSRRDSYVSVKKEAVGAKKTQVPIRRVSQEMKVRPRSFWNPSYWFKDTGSS